MNAFYDLQPESVSIAFHHEASQLSFLGRKKTEANSELISSRRTNRFRVEQEPSRGISAYASAEKNRDEGINRIMEAVQARSHSHALRQSFNPHGQYPNEFSFEAKEQVDQAFFDPKSSLQASGNEKPRMIPPQPTQQTEERPKS